MGWQGYYIAASGTKRLDWGVPESGEKIEKVYSEGLISAKKIKTDLRKAEPPLVDVKVTNPLTYLKTWWKRIIGNEGIDFRLRVKPLTAIAISIIILSVTMGIGRFAFPFKIPARRVFLSIYPALVTR